MLISGGDEERRVCLQVAILSLAAITQQSAGAARCSRYEGQLMVSSQKSGQLLAREPGE